MIPFHRKIAKKGGGSFAVVIPPEILREFGITEGDHLLLDLDEKNQQIIIQKTGRESYIRHLSSSGEGSSQVVIPHSIVKKLGLKNREKLLILPDLEKYRIIIKRGKIECVKCGGDLSGVPFTVLEDTGIVKYGGKRGYLCDRCVRKLDLEKLKE